MFPLDQVLFELPLQVFFLVRPFADHLGAITADLQSLSACMSDWPRPTCPSQRRPSLWGHSAGALQRVGVMRLKEKFGTVHMENGRHTSIGAFLIITPIPARIPSFAFKPS